MSCTHDLMVEHHLSICPDCEQDASEVLRAERAAHEQTKAAFENACDAVRRITARFAALESELARARPLLDLSVEYWKAPVGLAEDILDEWIEAATAYARAKAESDR